MTTQPISRNTSLAAYRMVLGQPRQEDLLSYLQDRLPDELLDRLIQELSIDLTPR